ncbi:MAG: transcriptional repressor [Alphaproteobacteria bacterium]|nr:transcriptional repressor [Alphaproteobacteria bacterium]
MSGTPVSIQDLTKNQAMVFGALSTAEGPLSAYAILDRLRDQGFRAPPQVYRALEKLVEVGLVHRLESLNAFVACSHPACSGQATHGHEMIAFIICESCAKVTEINDSALADQLTHLARVQDFALRKTTVELRGLCRACSA